MAIPEKYLSSPAMQLVQSQGWNWRNASEPNIEVEKCPYCNKGGYHLRYEIHSADDPQKNKDGLHLCLVCGKGGNLYSLKQHLGLISNTLESRKEYAEREKKVEALPDLEVVHQALLESEVAMDYLTNGRGFSIDVIKKQKLGLVAKRFFREAGEVPALVYPYLVGGQMIFCHYRTLPDLSKEPKDRVVKAFSSPTGWDVPLYNAECMNDPAITDVVLVEGEPDAIAALDHGVVNVCGVPGANFKKAEWITQLDRLDRVYICYDKDKTGQKAAQELANRIGVEKCWKITLPDFQVETEAGETRVGKDLNEWFVQGGGTSEAFSKLKEEATLFDVAGVASSKDAVQEFLDELEGKEGLEPKYKTGWTTVNTLVGFDPGDVIDIMAVEKCGKTTFALNLIEHMVDTYGEDGVFICLEMTRAKMSRKWISHMGQVADNIPKTPEEAKELKEAFMAAIPEVMKIAANRKGELYFCYPKFKTVDDIYDLIRDCIRRYGVKWVIIDNIQRLCDMTLGGKNRTEHLSQISKHTSQIGKDHGVQMVRILQPHRIKAGQIVSSDNVDGASQIAKDCDCMFTLHRTKKEGLTTEQFEQIGYIVEENAFGTDLFCGVPLSRYSGGGLTTLHYDGARSTVSEKTNGQIVQAKTVANQNVGHVNQMKAMGVNIQKAAGSAIEGDIPM